MSGVRTSLFQSAKAWDQGLTLLSEPGKVYMHVIFTRIEPALIVQIIHK